MMFTQRLAYLSLIVEPYNVCVILGLSNLKINDNRFYRQVEHDYRVETAD